VWDRARLLQAITRRLRTIGVTGTHGKTTGTAMTIAALRALGRDPSFMVGGVLVDLATNSHLGEEDLFVLEADEAFGTFLSLQLRGLVITNVEPDHLDHYGSLADLEDAFTEVAGAVDGPVVAGIDDRGAISGTARIPCGSGSAARTRTCRCGYRNRAPTSPATRPACWRSSASWASMWWRRRPASSASLESADGSRPGPGSAGSP
jgi:UDP-N-acetylmuramate-alanine ligase